MKTKSLLFLLALLCGAVSLLAQAAPAPVTATYKLGEPARIAFVSADGTTPFTFQWNKNGTPIAGATNTALTFAALAVGDVGTYTLTVKNSAGQAISNTASIAVNVPAGNVVIRFEAVPPATSVAP